MYLMQIALALLPIVGLILCISFFCRDSNDDFREVCLAGSVAWSLIGVFVAEIFGFFGVIQFNSFFSFWALFGVFATMFSFRKIPILLGLIFPILSQKALIEKFILLSLGFTLLITIVIGFTSPQNNYDSMTYHLPRIEHWLQNKTLAHFPTYLERQLYSNPLSEFILLHFRALSGSDLFSGISQWLSLIGCLLGVSLIAKRLGANKFGQYFSACFAGSIPMAILQGSSAQVDLVAAFFLVCFLDRILAWMETGSLRNCVLSGLTLGLSVCAKGTAYLFGFPFLVCISGWNFLNHRKMFFPIAFFICSLAVLPNFGHYFRNQALYETPIGIQYAIYPGQLGIRTTFSNLARNFAINLKSPFPPINRFIFQATCSLHSGLGWDVNDPETTVVNAKFVINDTAFCEGDAGNPLHFIIAAFSLSYILIFGLKNSMVGRWYSASIIAGGILFCSMLAWHPWTTRLTLPLLILTAPMIGAIVSEIRLTTSSLLVFLLIVQTFPSLFFNQRKPIFSKSFISRIFPSLSPYCFFGESIFTSSRTEKIFAIHPDWMPEFQSLFSYLEKKEIKEIGFISNSDYPEYFFWFFLNQWADKPRLEQVILDREKKTNPFPLGVFSPTFILSENDLGQSINTGEAVFKKNPVFSKFIFLYEKL